MRWYDSMEDSSAKGFIDLSEVETVKVVNGRHVQGAPKKADENAFFEVRHRLFYGSQPMNKKGTKCLIFTSPVS